MKYRYAACGLFLFALFPSLVSAITIERIAAVAGDDVITVQDLREEGATRYAIEGKTVAYIDSAPDREKKLEALTRDLVQTRLISRQAKKMDIHITDNMVDMQLQSMLHRMGQNEASLKEMLMQEGIDFNAYRNYIKNQIEAQYVIRNELVGQVEPNEADVIACAQEMAPGAERSVSVTMRQIMIPEVSADSTAGQKAPIASQLNGMWWNALDETLERYAYGVYDETKQQPDRFVEFVHKYSTGRTVERDGVLGTFSPGDLSSEFNVAFTLNKGEIAPMITSARGYHIVLIDDVLEGESETWNFAKKQCHEQLIQREGQRLTESWLSDLMEKNYVSIKVNNDIHQKTTP